jgi:hypothetical protein
VHLPAPAPLLLGAELTVLPRNFVLPRAGTVEEEARGGCAGFFEAEVLVLGQLDRAQSGPGEEFVEDLDGEVVAERAGFDASFQHGADWRLELALVGFLDSGSGHRS